MTVIFLLIVFLFSFLATFLVKKFAERKLIIDIPNERSLHSNPTPRGGGLAIALSWYGGITYLFFTGQMDPGLYYSFMAGILLSAIGFLDDLFDISIYYRLMFQSLAAIFALYFLGGLNKVDFGFYSVENSFLLTAITFFGILWFVNLYNFIDGIDGYAATQTVFVAFGLWFFLPCNIPLLLLAVIVLGFLPWNWQKAKIFMGDVGSTTLGFILIVFAIYFQNNNQFSLINWLVLTSVFWFDATYTLIKRVMKGEKITEPHKKHLYQRIVQWGFSHQKTVLFSLGINLILFSFLYLTMDHNDFILIVFFLAMLLLTVIKNLINKKRSFS